MDVSNLPDGSGEWYRKETIEGVTYTPGVTAEQSITVEQAIFSDGFAVSYYTGSMGMQFEKERKICETVEEAGTVALDWMKNPPV